MNDLTNIPQAACGTCGGWTSFGGMSHRNDPFTRTMERTGCTCRLRTSIRNHNAAMVECLDIVSLGENVYALGNTRDGYFATWAVNTFDNSSHWGHYGLMTRDDARRDMFDRAGLPLGSLDQLI